MGWRTEVEATVTMRPWPLARRWGRDARTMRTTLSKSNSNAFCQACVVEISKVTAWWPTAVVDQDVKLPEAVKGGSHEHLGRAGVGYVGRHRYDFGAVLRGNFGCGA